MTIRPWPLFKNSMFGLLPQRRIWLIKLYIPDNVIWTKKNLVQASSGSTGSLSSYDCNTYSPLTSKLATRWVDHSYTHDELTIYFEINSISFHLTFLRKVDGCWSCWSLVSMRHIIHKFVNVYPYIAYSCEVAIHKIISWILGSGPR